MKLIKKIGKALDRMMENNPFTTVGGVIITGILVAVFLGFLLAKAPLMAITMAGVVVVWIMVLFVSKFIKEMKR